MREYPLIKFILFFIAGIIASKVISFNLYIIAASVIILLFVLVFLIRSHSQNPFMSLPVLSLCFFSGMLIMECSKPSEDDFLPQSLYKQENFIAYGEISAIELPDKKGAEFTCRTDSFSINEHIFNKQVQLICKLKYKTSGELNLVYSKLKPGNIISLEGTYRKGRDRRNPGEFDYNMYLNERGISGILSSYKPDNIKIIKGDYNWFSNLFLNCRKYLARQIDILHNSETSAMLKGLLLADRSGIDYETKNNFINAGVIHVLAVSGSHVVCIALIFILLTGRLNIYLRSFLIIIGLLFFMFLTGAAASVVRSVIMSMALIAGYLFNRSTNIYNSMSLAAFLILVIDPNQLFDAGFQLSFAAVLSMAVLYPLFKKEVDKLKRIPPLFSKILLFCLLSVSAQIGTLPFTLFYFSKLSLVAVLANVIIIPLSGLMIGSGIFTLMINFIFPSIAQLAAAFNELMNAGFTYVVNAAGRWDYSFIYIRQFSLLDGIIFYFFLSLTVWSYHKIQQGYLKLLIFSLSIINIILLCSLDNKVLLPDGELSVLMIDVGQGDAVLVKLPDSKTALVDAGNATSEFDNGERIIIPLLDYLGIDKVDYGFVSHMDSDHYSGFVSLVHNKRVGRIIKTKPDTIQHELKFEKFLDNEGMKVQYVKNGPLLQESASVYTMVNSDAENNSSSTMNDRSMLVKITFDKTSILFTGDAGRKAEKYFVSKYGKLLHSDILKVSHHGSNTGTSKLFLETNEPSVALISAGIKNQFNLPSKAAINRLLERNCIIYRTDLEGAILFRSDGSSFCKVNWR